MNILNILLVHEYYTTGSVRVHMLRGIASSAPGWPGAHQFRGEGLRAGYASGRQGGSGLWPCCAACHRPALSSPDEVCRQAPAGGSLQPPGAAAVRNRSGRAPGNWQGTKGDGRVSIGAAVAVAWGVCRCVVAHVLPMSQATYSGQSARLLLWYFEQRVCWAQLC